MAVDKIGRITRQPLREVWRNEPRNFTTWLLENTDVISDLIDLELRDVRREQAAGDFSVDLVAEDEEGNIVVIENQLEKSNHDHLGKVVTYVASLGAKNAIWIVADPRPEHTKAIAWLNESGLASFYLLKVEAISIGDSEPAPLLTLITGPSEEAREIGETKKDSAERYHVRRRFWEALLNASRGKTRLFEAISPGTSSYLWAGAGKSHLGWKYNITQRQAEVAFYINRDPDQSREIFKQLLVHKPEIEESFGGPLVWFQQEGVQHCRIEYVIEEGGYKDEEKWSVIQNEMISKMVSLEKSLRPYLAALDIY